MFSNGSTIRRSLVENFMGEYLDIAAIIAGIILIALGIMLGVAYHRAKEIEREES